MQYGIQSYVLKKEVRILHLAVTAFLAFFMFLLILCNPLAVHSQEKDFPDPINPSPNAVDVPVSKIVFSWKPFYVATNEYTFQLSKNSEMDPLIDEQKLSGTTYQYNATLEYDTTYYWKIWASDPLGGQPITSIFTTISEPAAEPAPPADEDASSGGFFDDPDWALIGFAGGGVIIVAFCAYYFLRPRKSTAGRRQRPAGFQGARPMGQPQLCPVCGAPNQPGRQFCANCGAPARAPDPPPGPPPGMGMPRPGVCASCGAPNQPGRQFCGNCGAQAAPAPPPPGMQQAMPAQRQQAMPAQRQQPPGMQQAPGMQQPNICTSCGTPNPPEKQFCGNCGANLTAPSQQNMEIIQAYSCPICGASITPQSNPCSNCGTWLDWGS